MRLLSLFLLGVCSTSQVSDSWRSDYAHPHANSSSVILVYVLSLSQTTCRSIEKLVWVRSVESSYVGKYIAYSSVDPIIESYKVFIVFSVLLSKHRFQCVDLHLLLHIITPKSFCSSTACNNFHFRVDALSYFQYYTFIGVEV